MKKRDKKRENKEILRELAMVTCMGISFGIGYYIDRLAGTRYWVMIFLLIGILASIRSLFILTGRLQSSEETGKKDAAAEATATAKEDPDEGSKPALHRVIGIIWLLAAVVLAAGLVVWIFHPFSILPYTLGEVLGSGVSTLLMLHRFSTLDLELDLERKSAVNHSKVMATLRSIAALAALFAGFRFPWLFHPATTFAGLFATKAAALLYPVIFREKSSSDSSLSENKY